MSRSTERPGIRRLTFQELQPNSRTLPRCRSSGFRMTYGIPLAATPRFSVTPRCPGIRIPQSHVTMFRFGQTTPMDIKNGSAIGMRPAIAATAAIIASLAITACGAYAPTTAAQPLEVASAAPTAALPVSTAVGTLSQPRDYPTAQVHLDPPGSASPTISASAAFGTCADPNAVCHDGSPASEELALLTDVHFGYDHRIVWVLTWPHVSCQAYGPPNQPSPKYNMATGCDFITFLDGNTGVYLFALDVGTASA